MQVNILSLYVYLFSTTKLFGVQVLIHLFYFQNPNEDTEWNDVLRAKGILPPKEKEVSEEEIVNMIEQTIQQKQAESE